MTALDTANALHEARSLVRAANEIAFMLTVVGEREGDGAVNIEAVGIGLDCVLKLAESKLDEAHAALGTTARRSSQADRKRR